MHKWTGIALDTIDKINAILKERGISGAELSREIGLSSGTYSLWNTRRSEPSTKTLRKVSKYLDVPYSSLVADEDEMHGKTTQTEKAAPDDRSGYEKSVIDLMQRLTEAEKQQALAFMYGLAAHHNGHNGYNGHNGQNGGNGGWNKP